MRADLEAGRVERYPLGASIALDALYRDPYPILARLREAEPISWIPALNMWFVTRYDLVERILRDPVHFATGGPHSTIEDTFGLHMLTVEGDMHDRYKLAMRGAFTPSSIRSELEGRIADLVRVFVDRFADAGEVDIRHALAERLPIQVMLVLFGIDLDAERDLRRWYSAFEAALANFTWDETVRTRAKAHVSEFDHLLQKRLNEVRRNPDGGYLSAVVQGSHGLQDDEIIRNAMIIFFGGISTVEALILNSLYAVLTVPDLKARVDEDLSLLPLVLEETIRWLAPVQSATRHVMMETTVEGVTFRPGDTVNCMLGAANHDPAVFDHPEEFRLNRANIKRHLGFASGTHHCLGSHLAKAEARITLEHMLTGLPNLRLHPGHDVTVEGYEFRQPRKLVLAWG